MTAAFLIRTVIEAAVVLLIIWGLFHEKQLVALETQLIKYVMYKRNRKKRANVTHQSQGVKSPPEKEKIGETRRVA